MAAGPARGPVQALRPRLVGERARPGFGDARRSSAERLPTACPRSAGPSRSPATPWSRCARRPTRSRSAARSSFSLAAFRQAFAAGRDLTDPDNVVLAAAAAELHPRAVTGGPRARLREAGAARGDRRGRRPRRARGPQRGRGRRGVLGRRPPRAMPRSGPPALRAPEAHPAAALARSLAAPAGLSWAAVAQERTKTGQSGLAGDGRGAARRTRCRTPRPAASCSRRWP